jgi:hypothetical protein
MDQEVDLVYDTSMGRSVTITTPIPSLEEVGKRLKMSKARQQRLIEIVRSSVTGRFVERRRDASVSANRRSSNRSGAAKGAPLSKKSERAAAS